MADFPGAALYGSLGWPLPADATPYAVATPDVYPATLTLDLSAAGSVAGTLELAGIAQASTRAIDAGFTYEVAHVDPWAPGDALNLALYSLTSSPAVPLPNVQAVEHVGPGVVRLFLDADLPVGITVTLTVSAAIEAEDPARATGSVLSASLVLPTWGAVTTPARLDVPEERRDLRNPQAPNGTDPLGTIAIDSRGDYDNEDGIAYFRKRILRRATTTAGGFVLMPDYGFAPLVKTLTRASDLRPLTARIRSQVLEEPDAVSATVELAVPSPGVLVIRIAATMRDGTVVEGATTAKG